MRLLAVLGVIVLGVVLLGAGAGGALWMTGAGPFATGAGEAEPVPAAPVASGPGVAAGIAGKETLEIKDIETLLGALDPARRGQIVDSMEAFGQFVEQEALNQSVIRAALANDANKNPVIAELMERAALKVLAESYLNQVVRTNLDPAFPTDDQVKAYFDENAAQFMTPERVHVWQIYLAVPPDAGEREIKSIEQQANSIALELKQEPGRFAALAAEHSAHLQSRLNDGYMGLIKLADLLPEIREEIARLKQGTISKPVRTDTGFHVIRRGELVSGQPLALNEVAPQVRQSLRRDAAGRVRQAALAKIRGAYPVEVDGQALPAWREQIRAAAAR
ncbi:MAG: peptidylprolyl isomerase [Gammaproteobacteria bacterium]|nr:peptidylprolyl isomerase [Gammaproteobacteria bacterium]